MKSATLCKDGQSSIFNFLTARRDQTFTPKLLERPVHVHGRQSHRVRHMDLRDWPPEAFVVGAAGRAKAEVHFAKEMRKSLVGRAATQVDHPFPLNRRIDQGFLPEGSGNSRVRLEHTAQGRMGRTATVARLIASTPWSRCPIKSSSRSQRSPSIANPTICRLPSDRSLY